MSPDIKLGGFHDQKIFPLTNYGLDPRYVGMLLFHIEGQRDDLAINGVIPDIMQNGGQILEWYKNSPSFDRQTRFADNFLSKPRSHDEIVGFRHKFVGAVFEEVVYPYLCCSIPKGTFLLSSGYTSRFFFSLFADASPDEGRYIDNAPLSGIYVPDALLVDSQEMNIHQVYEMTLSNDEEKFRTTLRDFKYLKRHYPDIFPRECKLQFVVPENRDVGIRSTLVKVTRLPFSSYEFSSFVKGMY
jgi:hypothetical protein